MTLPAHIVAQYGGDKQRDLVFCGVLVNDLTRDELLIAVRALSYQIQNDFAWYQEMLRMQAQQLGGRKP